MNPVYGRIGIIEYYMKRFLGLILMLVFLAATPVALTLHSVQKVVINPKQAKDMLITHRAYQTIIDATLAEIQQNDSLVRDVPIISGTDVAVAVKSVFTPVWLQEQSEYAIDGFFNWLESSQDIRQVEIVIPLGEIKERASNILVTSVQKRILELPECTEQQRAVLSGDELMSRGICFPDGSRREEIVKNINAETVLDRMPTTVHVVNLLREGMTDQQADEVFTSMNSFRDNVSRATAALRILFVILLLLLLLTASLGMASGGSLLRWFGFPLLIAGLVSLLAPLILLSRYEPKLLEFFSNTQWPSGIGTLIQDITSEYLATIVRTLRVYAIVLTTIGGILFGVSFLMPKKKSKEDASKDKKQEPPKAPILTLQEKFHG